MFFSLKTCYGSSATRAVEEKANILDPSDILARMDKVQNSSHIFSSFHL